MKCSVIQEPGINSLKYYALRVVKPITIIAYEPAEVTLRLSINDYPKMANGEEYHAEAFRFFTEIATILRKEQS